MKFFQPPDDFGAEDFGLAVIPFLKLWQTAAATPSVASRYSGVSAIFKRFMIIEETCSLDELPRPVMDCLICRGEYSKIGMSR